MDDLQGLRVCWLGGARYSNPLNSTSARKWSLLAELGLSMSVVGFSRGLRPQRFTQQARFYLLPAPPLPPLRHALFFLLGTPLVLWLLLRGRVDVLVAQSPYEGAAAALARGLARLAGRRAVLIVENHGDFEEALFMQRRVLAARLYRGLMRRLARYALARADLLRAISSSTQARLQAYRPDCPVYRFATWTDSEVFMAQERTAPPSVSLALVYVGVLTPLKGLHILLEAFTRLRAAHPQAQLYLIGHPENAAYAAELRARAAQADLQGHVHFIEHLPQPELAGHLAGARALALPSLSEGLGRVIIEAMLCGTPVVASRVGGIPDLVQDGQNGRLVAPGDAEALAAALLELYAGDDVDRLGEQARAGARQHFSAEIYREGYRALLLVARALLDGGA